MLIKEMLLYSFLGKITAGLYTPVYYRGLLSWTATGNRVTSVLAVSFRRQINPKPRPD